MTSQPHAGADEIVKNAREGLRSIAAERRQLDKYEHRFLRTLALFGADDAPAEIKRPGFAQHEAEQRSYSRPARPDTHRDLVSQVLLDAQPMSIDQISAGAGLQPEQVRQELWRMHTYDLVAVTGGRRLNTRTYQLTDLGERLARGDA